MQNSFSRISWLWCGFSTREWGDLSKESFRRRDTSFNTFAQSLGVTLENFVLMGQVHGNNVRIMNQRDAGSVIDQTDGLVTKEKGLVLVVQTADCLPILFADVSKKIIGVAHAGWRGTLAGIGASVVNSMTQLGSDPKDILIDSGPCLGPCHFEVKEDVFVLFKDKFGADKDINIERKGKTFLDLRKANFKLLLEAGINPLNIKTVGRCTYCQPENFFSFRRDGNDFRQMGWVGIKK
ncbi:MAG: peptidoglycan editing factor PgeF [Patescibacteria group bacterium]|nr:peptidoglycan editing factor PgeF [Patescibacteria group bacterium]